VAVLFVAFCCSFVKHSCLDLTEQVAVEFPAGRRERFPRQGLTRGRVSGRQRDAVPSAEPLGRPSGLTLPLRHGWSFTTSAVTFSVLGDVESDFDFAYIAIRAFTA
jgi:hypothetical protein